ncbi:MAG: peptidylprolyl isomerase [Sphingomonadaceae bacterium]|jgi:peptidylprolyl isomerase|nr:peptidylprolyl isomerase [Sphingomonadaceae bacterium]
MITRLIAAAAFASLALVPVAAYAQDSEEEAAPAETPRVYDRVSFDINEDRDNILLLDLSNGKRVAIRLMPSWAPNHVERIKTLARQGFYDGIIFHRVIEGFMAQTGDPTGTGQGGSSLPDLKEEFNPMPHLRGTVSMARATSEDSANSQFFITFMPRFSLDKRYTNFGRVISGMDGIDGINRGEPPANPTRIVQASIAADGKPVPAPTILPVDDDAPVTLDMLNASRGN